jgi:hypothetical protein
MIEKSEVIACIDTVRKAYEMMCEVDKHVATCGISPYTGCEWHVYKEKDFDHIADLFNAIVVTTTGKVFDRKSCVIRNVTLFTLIHKHKEVDDLEYEL